MTEIEWLDWQCLQLYRIIYLLLILIIAHHFEIIIKMMLLIAFVMNLKQLRLGFHWLSLHGA
jgi:hypothetical protein